MRGDGHVGLEPKPVLKAGLGLKPRAGLKPGLMQQLLKPELARTAAATAVTWLNPTRMGAELIKFDRPAANEPTNAFMAVTYLMAAVLTGLHIRF